MYKTITVVSYRNSTSNHNSGTKPPFFRLLYLIEILHQTTTVFLLLGQFWSCILSKFYIKPQRRRRLCRSQGVVSYRNSTSNHNCRAPCSSLFVLYLIEILHQTTTGDRQCFRCCWLYLIEILHQTTTAQLGERSSHSLYLIEILHQTTTRCQT